MNREIECQALVGQNLKLRSWVKKMYAILRSPKISEIYQKVVYERQSREQRKSRMFETIREL